jgi:hypothetical protein
MRDKRGRKEGDGRRLPRLVADRQRLQAKAGLLWLLPPPQPKLPGLASSLQPSRSRGKEQQVQLSRGTFLLAADIYCFESSGSMTLGDIFYLSMSAKYDIFY